MTNPDDPAFPNKDHMGDGPEGLTKCEYLAALAMAGHLNSGERIMRIAKERGYTGTQIVVGTAVALADALIAELNKP